jgi:hypothetical protein
MQVLLQINITGTNWDKRGGITYKISYDFFFIQVGVNTLFEIKPLFDFILICSCCIGMKWGCVL